MSERRIEMVCAAHGILGHRCTIAVPRDELSALRARLAEAEAKLATCATALEQTVRERDDAGRVVSADRADRVNERGHTRVVEMEAEIGSLRARLAEAEAENARLKSEILERRKPSGAHLSLRAECDKARARLAEVERERDAAQAECILIARRVSETYFVQRDEARRERDAARADAAKWRTEVEGAWTSIRVMATPEQRGRLELDHEVPGSHTRDLAQVTARLCDALGDAEADAAREREARERDNASSMAERVEILRDRDDAIEWATRERERAEKAEATCAAMQGA